MADSSNDGRQEEFAAKEHIQQTEEENIQRTEEEHIQQAEEENIQRTEEEHIQQTEEENIQRTKEEHIQQAEEEHIQETEEENIQETEEENIQETEEENIQQTEEENNQLTDEEKGQQTKKETLAVHAEMRSMYQKLLDGEGRYAVTNEPNEIKDTLKEAKHLIFRLKSTQGQVVTEDIEIFRLLCDTVKDMSKDFNSEEQKFYMEEYAHNLTRKFNFSTDNSGNIIETKLQVISLGKEISKFFSRAPTMKFLLGTLETEEGEMKAKISDLPDELLRYIFLMLSLEDRKMTVLVSQWWRSVGEDKVLWKWSVIKIRNGEDVNKLSLGRIRHVQKICVNRLFDWQDQQLEKLFKATLELPKLKEIEDLQWIDLRSVNSQLLGRALGKLEELYLNANTTNDQRVAIFNEMAKNGSIKNLTMSWIDLRTLEVDAGILAKAMSGLKQLELTDVSLTNDQAQKLYKSMSENNQLNAVYFSILNLSLVEPEIFGAALGQVEAVSLDQMDVSPKQVRSLLAEMDRRHRIKSIDITEIDMSSADPKLFARVMSKLEQVTLIANNLTNEQVRQLFAKMKENCSKISLLQLSENNLSPVDPDDLANVVNNIEEVYLNDTDLTTDQITAVLTRAQANTKLKKLSIFGNRITEVDLAIVTRAKEIIGELDIDSESEFEDDDSDEEDSLDGFIVNESDNELDGDEESDGGN